MLPYPYSVFLYSLFIRHYTEPLIKLKKNSAAPMKGDLEWHELTCMSLQTGFSGGEGNPQGTEAS